MTNPQKEAFSIDLPDWVYSTIDWQKTYSGDTEKMALAIELANQNINRNTGGPFGAAIFDKNTGGLLSVGVNSVLRSNNSILHAEVMAIMFAEQRLQSYSLDKTTGDFELFSSCEPCAMCLGAICWSGVKRLVCAATADDARSIGFDEGPVFAQSYEYLHNKGVKVLLQFSRQQGRSVLAAYTQKGGIIYNP